MKECQSCKTPFLGRKNALFCSRSCAIKHCREIKSIPDRIRKGETKKCVVCGIDFYAPKYRAEKAKYCSRKCLAIVHLKQFSEFRFKPSNMPKHKYKAITTPDGRKMREHRYVMEVHMGRKLLSNEHVHHVNGDSLDNRIENLILLSNADHQRLEISLRKQGL